MADILIVDDETSLVNSLGFALRAEGYAVASAGTGEAGVLAAQASPPSLVLLDLRLPDGCAFHPRCPFFDGEAGEKVVPPLTFFRDGSAVACHPVQRQREAEIIATPTGMN